jgi:hypothetical protein
MLCQLSRSLPRFAVPCAISRRDHQTDVIAHVSRMFHEACNAPEDLCYRFVTCVKDKSRPFPSPYKLAYFRLFFRNYYAFLGLGRATILYNWDLGNHVLVAVSGVLPVSHKWGRRERVGLQACGRFGQPWKQHDKSSCNAA